MALQRCGLFLSNVTLLLLLLSVLVDGMVRFKGFRRFKLEQEQEQDSYRGAGSEEHWITQRLDHFNGADSRVWKQRYFVNEAFHRPGGPVFLMISGENPASTTWMDRGAWLTYAQRLGALCFMLEHRFYGESHPTADLSTDNMRFLTSRQALADLAHFRTVMAETRGLTNNKWVAFGGSYPGSLAAWFRMKYPHLVHASVASSAPVYATVDFREYLEVVGRSLASENAECPQTVKKASDTVAELLKDPKTYDNITKDFNLCSKLQIQTEMDSAFFLEQLAGNFMDVVQYNKEHLKSKHSNITIKVLCDVMGDTSLGDPYARYAAVARLMSDKNKCLDANYTHYLRHMSNTSWHGPCAKTWRQWFYQTCTEFGFFQSTDSPNQPFTGIPLVYYLNQCADLYNISSEQVANAVAQTNEYFGGYDIRSTRIVFPNGSIDPWHALGITHNITAELPAIYIEGTAHCANMYAANNEDPPQLTLARERIFSLLQEWLEQ